MAKRNRDSSFYEQGMLFQPLLLNLPHTDWLRRARLRSSLKRPKAVHFIGTGSSYHVAVWSAHLFNSHGIDASAHHSFDIANTGIKCSHKGDWAIVISHRGAQGLTKEVLKRTKAARLRSVLVCGEQSPHAGFEFIAASAPEESKAHTQSLVGAICAITTLLCGARPTLRKELELQRERTADAMVDVFSERFLKEELPKTVLHVVGAGPFEAVALELRLKAMEVPHIAAQAHQLEEFLHGPAAAIERNHTILLLTDETLPASTLEARRARACELTAKTLGAKCIRPTWNSRGLAPAWQALLALAYGQRLCLETAQSRGLDPDSNRHEDPRYAAAFRHARFK